MHIDVQSIRSIWIEVSTPNLPPPIFGYGSGEINSPILLQRKWRGSANKRSANNSGFLATQFCHYCHYHRFLHVITVFVVGGGSGGCEFGELRESVQMPWSNSLRKERAVKQLVRMPTLGSVVDIPMGFPLQKKPGLGWVVTVVKCL